MMLVKIHMKRELIYFTLIISMTVIRISEPICRYHNHDDYGNAIQYISSRNVLGSTCQITLISCKRALTL